MTNRKLKSFPAPPIRAHWKPPKSILILIFTLSGILTFVIVQKISHASQLTVAQKRPITSFCPSFKHLEHKTQKLCQILITKAQKGQNFSVQTFKDLQNVWAMRPGKTSQQRPIEDWDDYSREMVFAVSRISGIRKGSGKWGSWLSSRDLTCVQKNSLIAQKSLLRSPGISEKIRTTQVLRIKRAQCGLSDFPKNWRGPFSTGNAWNGLYTTMNILY